MLHAFKQNFALSKTDWRNLLFFLVGGFLVGQLILAAVLNFAGNERWFPMSTLMAGISGIIAAILFDGLGFKQQYMLALSMGQARKPQLAANFLLSVLRAAAALLLIWPFSRIDLALYRALYHANGMEGGVSEFLLRYITPQYLLIGVLPIVCIGFLIAAVYGKFGKKGGIGIYIGFLAICMGLPRLIEYAHSHPNGTLGKILAALSALPSAAWIAIGILLMLLVLLASVCTLYKLRVELD